VIALFIDGHGLSKLSFIRALESEIAQGKSQHNQLPYSAGHSWNEARGAGRQQKVGTLGQFFLKCTFLQAVNCRRKSDGAAEKCFEPGKTLVTPWLRR